MRILLVTPWRPSEIGGISTVITRLASEFCKKGTENLHDFRRRQGQFFIRKIEAVGDVPVYGMYLRVPVSSRHFLRGDHHVLGDVPANHVSASMADLVEKTGYSDYPISATKYVLYRNVETVFQRSKCSSCIKGMMPTTCIAGALRSEAWCNTYWVRLMQWPAYLEVSYIRFWGFPDLQLKRIETLPNGASLDIVQKIEAAWKGTCHYDLFYGRSFDSPQGHRSDDYCS